MEKLQAALEKARARRETGGPPADTPRQYRKQRGAPDGSPHQWAHLKEISPSDEAMAQHLVVTQEAGQKATPFDILRTKVLLQMRQNGWKRLAVTSPMPKSGKTTTACNLALGLGRQSDLKAMLFDLDLTSPSVGSFLGYKPQIPISDMLLGKAPFEDQAGRIGENVAVSASPQSESDPTRILLTPQTEATLDGIQATYDPDIMIFDMPSILVSDNTRSFLKNVDCALIVARANNTRYGHFDACEREVAEYTNVVGVVLNAFRARNVQSYAD